ncbi:Fructose-1 [Blattella germanica]|nr:Fructose-1 [Blattella germanica]
MLKESHMELVMWGPWLPMSTELSSMELRLLYECFPMAYILSQAGGLASNGTIPILDIVPDDIHQRSPIFLGSSDDVEDVLTIIKKHNK